jgi:catechol 2,3-dioxygenase-like lactoylglutathione lyase family enzyme
MQLDHVSYAVTSAELADTVQRLGADLGAAFVDGGKHPRFGTRNFILPLAGGTYIEVVAPLDHPAAESAPFGQAVRQRAEAGGGWMGWVVQVSDLASVEARIGREAGEGHRVRPDGVDVCWKQIGLIDLMADPSLPYFINWNDVSQHPSVGFNSPIKISEIAISGDRDKLVSWLGVQGEELIDSVNLNFVEDEDGGIAAVTFQTGNGLVTIE